MAGLLDGKGETGFDPSKVLFIGTANSGTRVCVVNKDASAKTFEDALVHKTVIGGVAVNDATHDYAFMVKNITGAKLDVIPGYKGTSDIGLAMERKEVDGACGWDWASFKTQRSAWLRDGKVTLLVQIGHNADAELTKYGAPPIWTFIKNEEDRKAVELIVSQQVFHRSYIAPPGIPAAQLGILRTSFDATVQDPQFLADAAKANIDILPLGGVKIQELIERLAATPQSIVDRAKRAIRP
jgi:tripartite-type tricarboxylate transporter receptor subunit TctC